MYGMEGSGFWCFQSRLKEKTGGQYTVITVLAKYVDQRQIVGLVAVTVVAVYTTVSFHVLFHFHFLCVHIS